MLQTLKHQHGGEREAQEVTSAVVTSPNKENAPQIRFGLEDLPH